MLRAGGVLCNRRCRGQPTPLLGRARLGQLARTRAPLVTAPGTARRARGGACYILRCCRRRGSGWRWSALPNPLAAARRRGIRLRRAGAAAPTSPTSVPRGISATRLNCAASSGGRAVSVIVASIVGRRRGLLLSARSGHHEDHLTVWFVRIRRGVPQGRADGNGTRETVRTAGDAATTVWTSAQCISIGMLFTRTVLKFIVKQLDKRSPTQNSRVRGRHGGQP